VISGDISRVNSDALVTAINSSGAWFGGIDRVIQRVAGNHFHDQADALMPLSDGQTILASGNGTSQFQNVIFVVDDLQQPLGNIVFLGLQAAQTAGFKSVTIPTIRMGVMTGVVEKTKQEAVDRMADGIERFVLQGGQLDITFVVYSDKEVQALLSAAASQLNTTLSEVQS
jgi:O-acetyl-ADP-ribose deacetylase (regulator of RNase III)